MTGNGNDSRLVETHTAYLLLLGDRVYKWKKPVGSSTSGRWTRAGARARPNWD